MDTKLFQTVAIFLIIYVNTSTGGWHYFDPFVVIRFQGLEEFYQKVQTSQRPLDVGSENQASYDLIKFCKRVLSTNYFASKLETILDMESLETKMELGKYYNSIFEHYYQVHGQGDTSATVWYMMNRFRKYDLWYPNVDYEKKTISVLNTRIRETLVHSCFARQTQSQAIKQYFISAPYNLITDRSKYSNVAFLFTYNNSEELVVEALIDQVGSSFMHPPSSDEQIKIESSAVAFLDHTFLTGLNVYRTLGSDKKQGENQHICNLKPAEKLRLCASVMNLSQYQDEVKFWPSKFNVDYSCHKREVAFQYYTNLTGYTIWTIGCKAQKLDTGAKIMYHVSVLYYNCNNRSFIYKIDEAGKLVPDGAFTFREILGETAEEQGLIDQQLPESVLLRCFYPDSGYYS